MAKKKAGKKKTADRPRSTALQTEDIEVGGVTRHRLLYPEAARREAIEARERAQLNLAINRDAFRETNLGGLSKKQRRSARNLQKSISAYAEKYGSDEQAEAFRQMNPARLRWMVEHGIINPEEAFNYDDALDSFGFAVKGGKAQATLQRYIDEYQELSSQ